MPRLEEDSRSHLSESLFAAHDSSPCQSQPTLPHVLALLFVRILQQQQQLLLLTSCHLSRTRQQAPGRVGPVWVPNDARVDADGSDRNRSARTKRD
jgi:hypothetical protein